MKADELLIGSPIVHIPTAAFGRICQFKPDTDTVIVRFRDNDENEEVPIAELEVVGSPEATARLQARVDFEAHKIKASEHGSHEKPAEPNGKQTVDGIVKGIRELGGSLASGLLSVATINELINTRKAITRIADVGELLAVLQAQKQVPEHVAAQLDQWRDDLLESMAKRAKRRFTKKQRKPYSPPTVTKQVPKQDITI